MENIHFKSVLDNLNFGVLLLDESGLIIYQNLLVTEILPKLDNKQIKSKFISLPIFTTDHRSSLQQIIEHIHQTNKSCEFEFQLTKKTDKKRWIRLSFKSIKTRSKDVIQINVRDITDETQTKKNLKEIEERYKILMENSRDFLTILDKDFHIDFINAKFHLKEMGYPEEDVLGKCSLDFIHPNDKHKMLNLLKNKHKGPVDYRVFDKEGNIHWIETKGKSFIDEDGSVKALLISRDITKRKIIENDLRKTQDEYAYLIGNISDILVELDKEFNFTYVSPQVKEITGYSASEFLRSKPFSKIHQSDIDNVRKALNEIISGKKQVSVEYRVKKREGGFVYLHGKGKAIEINGELKIVAILRDISDQKLVEERLKQSEQKFRDLIHLLPEIIYEADRNLEVVYSNSIGYKTFGYTEDDLERGLNLKDMIVQEDLPVALAKISKVFKGEDTEPAEYTLIRKNGTTFSARVHSRPIYKNKKIIGIRGVIFDISDIKKTERKLRESEQKYRNLFEKSPNAIVLNDENGKLIDLNPSAERISGYSKADVIDKNYFDLKLFTEDHRKLFIQRFKEFKRGNNPGEIELKLVNKRGEKVWVNYQSSIIKLDGGYYIEAILQDITDKKIAEFELKKSESKYRNIIENSKEGYFEVDLKGDFTFFNDALVDLFGYHPNELIGMNYREYMDTENARRTYETFNSVFETGEEKKNYQYELIKKTGNRIYGETTITLRYDSEGRKIGFCGFMRDITDQKIAERKLKESEEKFRKIADQSILGICILQDDIVKYINKPFADLVGYSHEDILDWKPGEYEKVIHPEDRSFILEQAQKKQSGDPDVKTHYHFRMIKKGGEVIWVENYSKTIKYESKTANFVTLVDVTEKKKAEEIIKQENKRLKKLDEMRREFVNRASHELKTPLTSIHGAIQMLDKFYKNEFSQDSKEILEIAYRGTKRLKRLIYSLLDVSRLKADKFQLEKEKSDIIKIIKNCISDLKYLAEDRNMELTFQCEKEGFKEIFINIDKIRIEQVIMNLISNAIKNSPPYTRIEIQLNMKDESLELCVKDHGIGLTKEEKSKLFKKFSKIERYDRKMEISSEGTGLGLYISKEIVDSHGGKIWAESEGRYKGSSFFVKLPLE